MTHQPGATLRQAGDDFAPALVHYETLRRMARRLCANRAEADDLVQEAYLAALRHFDQFRPNTNCRAWLLTILRNRFLNHVRQERRWVRQVDGETLQPSRLDLPAAIPNPDQELSRRVVDGAVREALARLPVPFRETFLLAEVLEYSYREIAAACGVPVGTVMSRLFRARQFLRRTVGRDGNGRVNGNGGSRANGNGGPREPVASTSNGGSALAASGRAPDASARSADKSRSHPSPRSAPDGHHI